TRSRPARSPSYAASPRTPQTTTRRPSSPRTTSTTSSTTQARTTHDHPAPLRSCLDDRHALLPPRRTHRATPRRIHRQEQNMTAESSTHTYESGVQETVTLRRGPATPHDCALLKITYSDGEIADCYVNTAWLRDRADHLTDTPRPLTADDMTFEDNHAGRDLARERLDGWKNEWERRNEAEKERDKARAGARRALDRYREVQAERQKVVDELYRIRAEKAEEERDEARRYECSDLDAHWRLGEALASQIGRASGRERGEVR